MCMKSMRNTTGLGSGAGVDALCRFSVTLSARSRGFGRRSRSTAGSGDPPAPSRNPSPCCRLPGGPVNGAGKERERAPSRPSKTCIHDNLAPDGEACRAMHMHEEHAKYDRARPSASVDAPCRFSVTLSPQSRAVRRGSGSPRRRRPAETLTHLPPCCLYRADRPPAAPGWPAARLTALGKGRGSGRHRAPAKNLHSTTIPAQMARPVELCMKSMVNTTGLGPGAGVDAPCRFPVTLSPQSRGFGRSSSSNRGLRRPAANLTLPSPCRRLPSPSPTEAVAHGWAPATVNASTRPTRTRACWALKAPGPLRSGAR